MIVLIFFFVVGLGVVMGAELNAALAEAAPTALKGEIYAGRTRTSSRSRSRSPARMSSSC